MDGAWRDCQGRPFRWFNPGMPVTPALIEDKIFGLLATRQEGATICPSEVARALMPEAGAWRQLMPRVRQETA